MNNPVAEFPLVSNGGSAGYYAPRPSGPRETARMPANRQTPRLRIVSPSDPPSEALSSTVVAARSEYQSVFESNLHLIKGVIRFVRHRNRLNPTEAEDFESDVMLRLVENDYEILRRFQERSSLRTYLSVVIHRLFLDYRNRLWGKWRPSAEALRLGPIAVRLERLLAREGYELDQACEILRTNEGVTTSRAELDQMAARLPVRTRVSRVEEETLDTVAQDQELPDSELRARDLHASGLRIRRALSPLFQGLPDQDRLILRLRFQDGLGVADIARALNIDQKPLYPRFESLLRRLRGALEEAGIDRDTTLEVISRRDVDISLALLEDARHVPGPDRDAPATGV